MADGGENLYALRVIHSLHQVTRDRSDSELDISDLKLPIAPDTVDDSNQSLVSFTEALVLDAARAYFGIALDFAADLKQVINAALAA